MATFHIPCFVRVMTFTYLQHTIIDTGIVYKDIKIKIVTCVQTI